MARLRCGCAGDFWGPVSVCVVLCVFVVWVWVVLCAAVFWVRFDFLPSSV